MNHYDDVINFKRFRPCIIGHAKMEELHTGMRWGEGPVWFADGQFLLFVDIPRSQILRWIEDQPISVFRSPSNHANGNTRDRQGRLVTCEGGGRRVTRTELDGSITVIADRYQGKRFNSPNDIVVGSDDAIWFTDPDYGILTDYEGDKAESEIGRCNVFRIDPRAGDLRVATDEMVKPNKLDFSPDERILYIADSGASHGPDLPHHILAFDVSDDGKLRNRRVLAVIEPGVPDGMRVDVDGNIWTSAGDGVHCIAADGELIGKIRVPETVANLTFGGPKTDPPVHHRGQYALRAVHRNARRAAPLKQKQGRMRCRLRAGVLQTQAIEPPLEEVAVANIRDRRGLMQERADTEQAARRHGATIPETQVPGVYHRRVGDIIVTALSDGYLDAPHAVMRIAPQDADAILASHFRPSPPRIAVNAFAIYSGDRLALIETGSGSSMGPTLGWLRENLSLAGIDPAQIDTILLTHVHPDHSNGLVGDAGEICFPAAELRVHEDEVAHWHDDGQMARATERQRVRYFEAARRQLAPYRDRMRTFRKGEVFPGITAMPIPGHTPGHTAFLIQSGSESLLIWGDTVHVPEIQLERPDVTMEFDTDPNAAVAMRRHVFDMAASEGLLIAGMHLHFPSFGRMAKRAGQYVFVPEPFAFEI